jgi:hypothetical protein
MAALTHVESLSSSAQASVAAMLPRCQYIASRMPLVRVIVPENARYLAEIESIFRNGLLLRSHKSDYSRQLEQTLGAGDALYFHAGRPHPDYGLAILVFADLEEPAEVTPFGLGGLCCPNSDDSDLHRGGGCVSPVAHLPEREQRRFVEESTWHDDWRAQFAKYLAYYFGSEPQRYFLDGDDSRPSRSDPDGIFDDPHNRDWRIWTAEVRIQADIRLSTTSCQSRILWWGAHPTVERKLKRDAYARRTPLSELYPIWMLLSGAKRLPVEPTAGAARFATVKAVIQDHVL